MEKSQPGRRMSSFQFLIFSACSALVFGGAFGVAFLQDRDRAADLGHLAWTHYLYAHELKDDMALIDWSKDLEKIGAVKVFRVRLNERIVASGGNQNFLPSENAAGFAYQFPADWVFRATSKVDLSTNLSFTILFHLPPGPIGWGMMAFSLCFAAGGLGFLIARPTRPAPKANRDSPIISNPAPPKTGNGSQGVPSAVSTEPCYLFIDESYAVRQATPGAALLLGKKRDELLDGHLLDLAPDPQLIQAIEKGDEITFVKAFPAHPQVSVILKPDPNGSFLILKSPAPGDPPKNVDFVDLFGGNS